MPVSGHAEQRISPHEGFKGGAQARGPSDPATEQEREARNETEGWPVMINWTVTLTYEGWLPANELDDFESALETYDALVSSVPGLGFQAILHVDSADMIDATRVARDHAEPLAPGKLIELRAMTSEQHVAQADEPNLPELVSVAEIADMLGGVSRQRVHQLRSNLAFPKPLVELRTGAVWDARSITKFAAQWDRKPGRPQKMGNVS